MAKEPDKVLADITMKKITNEKITPDLMIRILPKQSDFHDYAIRGLSKLTGYMMEKNISSENKKMFIDKAIIVFYDDSVEVHFGKDTDVPIRGGQYPPKILYGKDLKSIAN